LTNCPKKRRMITIQYVTEESEGILASQLKNEYAAVKSKELMKIDKNG
jgi:hypothetical protein